MTDKSDLLKKLLDARNWRQSISESDIEVYCSDWIKIIQLCVESDEARAYWREHDTDEPNVLLATHIKRLKTEKKRFVEQACDAVEVRKNKLLEINESMPAKEQAMLVAGLCEAEQAIRDRFEENEQKEIKQKSNTNDLVRRFFNLTISERRNITQKLGLIENADMKVPEMERYKKAFIDAKEQGLIEQLADEVNKLEQANPSESS